MWAYIKRPIMKFYLKDYLYGSIKKYLYGFIKKCFKNSF